MALRVTPLDLVHRIIAIGDCHAAMVYRLLVDDTLATAVIVFSIWASAIFETFWGYTTLF